MTQTVMATYDGRDIHPDVPLPLPRDTRITLTWHAERVEQVEPQHDVGATTFFDVARSIRIDGPPDWSARIDHYLYGVDDGQA